MSSFHSRLTKGKIVEYEVAKLCAEYGFSVTGIGAIGETNIPMGFFSGRQITAPDLLIKKNDRFNPHSSITADEVKAKAPYNDQIWIDETRLNYAKDWADNTGQPFLFVFKDKPYETADPTKFVCASIEKLYGSHSSYNTHSKSINGSPEPTYLFDTTMFVPFLDVLEHGRQQTSYRYFLCRDGQKEVQV